MIAGKIIQVSCLYWDGTQWRGWYHILGDPALPPGSIVPVKPPQGAYAIYLVVWKNTGDTPMTWSMAMAVEKPNGFLETLVTKLKTPLVVNPEEEGVMQFGDSSAGGVWMDQKGSYRGILMLSGEAA